MELVNESTWYLSTRTQGPAAEQRRSLLRTTDGGQSFTNAINGALLEKTLVNDFHYDEATDTLYMASFADQGFADDPSLSFGSVFKLEQASTTEGVWTQPNTDYVIGGFGVARVVRDPLDSALYSIAGLFLNRSLDDGLTWERVFSNPPGFLLSGFELLRARAVISSVSGDGSQKVIMSDGGVEALILSTRDNNGGKKGKKGKNRGEIDPQDYSCSLTISSKCLNGQRRRNSRCGVTVSVRNEAQGSGERSRFILQFRANKDSAWRRVRGKGRTNKAGNGKFQLRPKQSGEYRLLVPKFSCTSPTYPIEIRKRGRR